VDAACPHRCLSSGLWAVSLLALCMMHRVRRIIGTRYASPSAASSAPATLPPMLLEVQFDGVVGPTHNYAGLSIGNVASTSHAGQTSHPKNAALQGLAKMRLVHSLGVEQAFLPPLERPDMHMLRAAGFSGDDAAVLAAAAADNPTLLAQASSASSMWTANAATIAPSCDTLEGELHITPANLISKPHRSIEPPHTARLLQCALPFATHHAPLSPQPALGDEGAANHTRLHTDTGTVHLFVYGADHDSPNAPTPRTFPARQTRLASATVAQQHQLPEAMVVLAQQHPDVIDAGVFHNDVICVGTGNVLLLHEAAFIDTDAVLQTLHDRLGSAFTSLVVRDGDLTVEEAVSTYLFNSQLLDTPTSGVTLICPAQVQQHGRARAIVDGWVRSGHIDTVHYVNLHESMSNGGGPACLRLRVPLRHTEVAGIHRGLRVDEARLDQLARWIDQWYPNSLEPADLADESLLRTSQNALSALCGTLDLPDLYPFQA